MDTASPNTAPPAAPGQPRGAETDPVLGQMFNSADPTFIIFVNEHSTGIYKDVVLVGGGRGDSGVDIRFPKDFDIPPAAKKTDGLPEICDLEIRVRCIRKNACIPFMIVPRSSIAKTSLSLANSVGVIDASYSGNIKVAIRNHSPTVHYLCEKGASLFQIVLPDLSPARVKVLPLEHPLFVATQFPGSTRGEGGFGSTGAAGSQ